MEPAFTSAAVSALVRSFVSDVEDSDCVTGVHWTVSDGTEAVFTSEEAAPTVAFAHTGVFTVTLAVTDFAGDVFETTQEVTIAEDEPPDEVTEPSTCGCASTTGSSWPLLLLAALSLGKRRSA